MIRLELIEARCDDCGRCDNHYMGIRDLPRLEGGVWRFTVGEWRHVEATIKAATKACKSGALLWVDERGEWG